MEIAAHNVKDRHKDAKFLYMPAWWNKVGPIMGDRFEVWNGLGHGGEGETSIMMAVRPELVNLEYAESQVPEKVIDEMCIRDRSDPCIREWIYYLALQD